MTTTHPGALADDLIPGLPAGYRARPPVRADASALTELLRACDIAAKGSSDMTLDEFLGDWEGTDLERDAVVIEAPDGTIAAYADRDSRDHTVAWTYTFVHPSQTGRGLEAALLAWGERRTTAEMINAPAGARVVVRHFRHEQAAATDTLLREHGYQPVRTTFVMEIELTSAPEPPPAPAGIAFRAYRPELDEVATYEAYEEAFADMWQRPRGTLEQFQSKTRRPYFNPGMWLLASDGDEIAATVLADVIEGKGWVEIVGVRRPWRGRGLALAMLLRTFRACWDRGVTTVGLSVDAESPTGATRLYERAGMRVTESFTVFEKELRPGNPAGMDGA